MDGKTRVILIEELNDLRNRIISNHISAGQKASGRTIQSLRVEIDGEGGILFGRQAFGVLETGRRGGNIPKGFIQIIRQWIIDKGIAVIPRPYIRQPSDRWIPKYTPEERGLMSMAGAIAHHIKEKGTSLNRSGGRADIYSNEIPVTIENIQKRILAIYETEIESININSNENTNI